MKKVFLTGSTGIMGLEAVKRFAQHPEEIELYALARPGKKNEEKNFKKVFEDVSFGNRARTGKKTRGGDSAIWENKND